MQGSEEKKKTNAALIKPERETWQTRALTTKLQRRRSVAYAGFSKGGVARKFRKFEINEDQNENFPAQNQVCLPAQT